MRSTLVLVLALGAAACDDASSRRLVSSDVAAEAADGCVVPSQRRTRVPRTWLVREGDSLRRIARESYGDEKLWQAVADANPGHVGADGLIVPGAVLTIPFDGI